MTAVEWLVEQLEINNYISENAHWLIDEAKEIEKKQLFLSSNTSAKDAYKAGQTSMYCGCYEIEGSTTYEEWLYEQIKNK
jgi:hypothetical protein